MSVFGSQSLGGSWQNLSGGTTLIGGKYTLTEAGTINSITVFIGKDSGAGNYKCELYDASGNLVGETASVALSSSYDWYTNNLIVPYSAAAADYVLMAWSNGTVVYMNYAGGSGIYWQKITGITFPDAPNPITAYGSGVDLFSIYATYTAGGGKKNVVRMII